MANFEEKSKKIKSRDRKELGLEAKEIWVSLFLDLRMNVGQFGM